MSKFTRREFLKTTAVTGIAAAGASLFAARPAAAHDGAGAWHMTRDAGGTPRGSMSPKCSGCGRWAMFSGGLETN